MEKLIYEYMERQLFGQKTDMCYLFEKYHSDKSSWHNYTTFYDYIFKSLCLVNKPINLFELGLGTNNVGLISNMGSNGVPGASLRAFSKYFPNANIHGADIDKDILFQEDRIKTYFCDQTSPEIIKQIWDQIDVDFDVIIDDALHEAHANITFFENSYHKLKKGGIFIIEDILNKNKYPIEKFLRDVDCEFQTVMSLPMVQNWSNSYGLNIYDNIIAVIIK